MNRMQVQWLKCLPEDVKNDILQLLGQRRILLDLIGMAYPFLEKLHEDAESQDDADRLNEIAQKMRDVILTMEIANRFD